MLICSGSTQKVNLAINKSLHASMVAHTCNPSYSGGGDWQDRDWRVAGAKKLVR
jgi:hypothetical protein